MLRALLVVLALSLPAVVPAQPQTDIVPDVPTPEDVAPRLAGWEQVTGTVRSGDRTTRFDAYLDDGRLAYVRTAADSGGSGSSVEHFFLSGGEWPSGYRRVATVTVGGRASDAKRGQVELTVALDATGASRGSVKTVDGTTVVMGDGELTGILAQFRLLQAAIARLTSPDSREFAGTWSGRIAAGAASGTTITLALGSDHRARLVTDARATRTQTMQEGWWRTNGSRAVVILALSEGAPVRPTAVSLERRGEQLAALEYDRGAWGQSAPAFERVPGLPAEAVGLEWRWIGFTSPAERLDIPRPEAFTLMFDGNGQVAVRADCNRGRGKYQVGADRKLLVGPFALSRRSCGASQLDGRFARELQRVTAYSVRDGELVLEIPADGASLRFVTQR